MNNKNFAVGMFVAAALAVFVVATLWLTGKQGSEPTVNYSMFFEKDVGGLMLGGPVFYLGVEVGAVTAMDIVPGNPMRVRVDAEVLKSTPIDAGTYASLAFQGITGVAVIKLYADPGVHDALQITGESGFPVIVIRDTGFSALLSKAPSIFEELDAALVQINQVLGEENRELINAVLVDFASVTNELAAQKKTIGELPGLLKTSLQQIDSSLAQLKSMAVKMEPGLIATVANLEEVTENLVKMSARLEQWTATNDADVNAFMAEGLGEVPALVKEAQITLREVRKLVKELRKDPSALIYKPNERTKEVEK
jgi:phospholipid/cholesterol/gamma-HCH transport system substrate-binding protein